MIYLPRTILLFAAQNYLNKEQMEILHKDLCRYKKITDRLFLRSLGKYFDFRWFRDKPFIPEDIWLFNYLMYETKKPDNFNPLDFGNTIALKGRLLKIGLIAKYERKIILPQLNLLFEAKMILKDNNYPYQLN